jgi:hypothetical protein
VSTTDDVREFVEELEAAAEEQGWDQPPVLHRLYFDWRGDGMSSAVVPLHFMHPHAPTALQVLGQVLESGQLPLQVWPKVGEIALVCIHEAWMANPDAWSAEFTADYDEATKEANANDDTHAYQAAVETVYRKHYGPGWSMSDIPGSREMRCVAVLMGKHAWMYQRERGGEPEWLGEEASEFVMFGRMHDAMTNIQRLSRLKK